MNDTIPHAPRRPYGGLQHVNVAQCENVTHEAMQAMRSRHPDATLIGGEHRPAPEEISAANEDAEVEEHVEGQE